MGETVQKQKRSGTILPDHLAFKLTPSERIVFGVIHRFSNYQLGECRLKPARIAEIAGVSRSTAYSVVKKLIDIDMVQMVVHTKSTGAKFCAFVVTKDDLDDQKSLSGEAIDLVEYEHVSVQRNRVAVKNSADPQDDFGDEAVKVLFDYWNAQTQLIISSGRKANRRAAWNMAKKHGIEEVKMMISIAARAKYDDFGPRIADLAGLQSKWNELRLWAERKANEKLMEDFEKLSIEDRAEFKQRNPELAKIIKQKREAKS